MTKELPELSDREVVQLMAAQRVIMDSDSYTLEQKYKQQIEKYAEEYDVEVNTNL